MSPMKSPAHHEHEDELDQTWTLTHVAHRWGVSRREVRHLLSEGQLPFVEIQGQIRVPAEAVYQYELGTPPLVE